MSTLKVAILSLAIPLAAAVSQADAYTVLPLPVTPSATGAVSDSPVVSTQSGTARTAACSQLERNVGLAPAECGTYTTSELAAMYLAMFD